MTLTEADIAELAGINEDLSVEHVEQVYLPISRLLNLQVGAVQELTRATDTFLGLLPAKLPYVIGLAGSVAVGKSTTARILAALLARWPNTPRVDLITTDGFLHPNAVLEERDLMGRKGFPESYDRRALLDTLAQLKTGSQRVEVPVYSHLTYDILDERKVIESPDIVIVEGLNVLQTPGTSGMAEGSMFVSDYFDYKIYVDAPEAIIREWYVQRFFALRKTAFADPRSYFRRFSELSDEESRVTAEGIWDAINGPNLAENILPTRGRADLILTKQADHTVGEMHLRRS